MDKMAIKGLQKQWSGDLQWHIGIEKKGILWFQALEMIIS